MILITGGAGFIGSNIVSALSIAGRDDIIISDWLGEDGKWRNLAKSKVRDIIRPECLSEWDEAQNLSAVIHMGAVSATTATNGDHVFETNYRLSVRLLDFCTKNEIPFIYASSAATYGNGDHGFQDDEENLETLQPMNLYGWSKHAFDKEVMRRVKANEDMPPHWAGLKFFNVFGPNEYHKGPMMSVLAKKFADIKSENGHVDLFRSRKEGIKDGGQQRDFIYVTDVVRVTLWILEKTHVNGIFNVGTGKARSFRDLIEAGYAALKRKPSIHYVEMPESIAKTYQYFTEADMRKLLRAGYPYGFTSLEEAVSRYINDHLNQADCYL